MSGTPSRAELDARVLELISRGPEAEPDDAEFEAIALALFRHQYTACSPYRAWCDALGGRDRVSRWRDVPAVPTGAFKRARLAGFPPESTRKTFRTSGSTLDLRGELHLDTLALYEASLLQTFRAHVLPDRAEIALLILAPSARDAPDSSLSHMFDVAVRELGATSSAFLIDSGPWRPTHVIERLSEVAEPVALCGTAFAFVHLIDALDERGRTLALPAESRVMETGGFKGRSRELSRAGLHGAIARALGVPVGRIVNQYGMCELGSQFYEPTLSLGRATETKAVPPWVRTRVVDPATFEDRNAGEPGLIVHYDLANTGSVLAVETSDLGRRLDAGFEVLGRLAGAEARGCSIAADEQLGEALPA